MLEAPAPAAPPPSELLKPNDVFDLQKPTGFGENFSSVEYQKVEEIKEPYVQHAEAARFAIESAVGDMEGRNNVKAIVIDEDGVMHGVVQHGWIRKKHSVVTADVMHHVNSVQGGPEAPEPQHHADASTQRSGLFKKKVLVANDEHSKAITINRFGTRGARERNAKMHVVAPEHAAQNIHEPTDRKPVASVQEIIRNGNRAKMLRPEMDEVILNAARNEPRRIVRDAERLTDASNQAMNMADTQATPRGESQVIAEAETTVRDSYRDLERQKDPHAYHTKVMNTPPPPGYQPSSPKLANRTGNSPPSVSPLAERSEPQPPPPGQQFPEGFGPEDDPDSSQ